MTGLQNRVSISLTRFCEPIKLDDNMVTMQDIAKAANVSRSTVSFVLNDKHLKNGDISPDTRKRVMDVATKLGYRRNELALSVKTGKSNVIAVLGYYQDGFSMEIINGITETAVENNYLTKILKVSYHDDISAAVEKCAAHRVAGLICRSISQEQVNTLKKLVTPYQLPVVLVDSCYQNDWCSTVTSNDFDGAKQGVEFIIKNGHKRIFHITDELEYGFAQFRYNGYLAAMNEAKLDIPDELLIIDHHEENFEVGLAKITGFIKKHKPEAIFCGSDYIAMKVLIAATELGLKIPKDISVMGFADLQFARLANPPLTTVRQFPVELGRKAFDMLNRHLANPKLKPQKVTIETDIIVRKSVKLLNSK